MVGRHFAKRNLERLSHLESALVRSGRSNKYRRSGGDTHLLLAVLKAEAQGQGVGRISFFILLWEDAFWFSRKGFPGS